MKAHLTLCLPAWNADASHTQNWAKLAWLRRPRLCMSIDELFVFALWRGLRHGYVSPSPCSFRSLYDRDALPFNQLIRNFKRNSACYEQQRHNFDRIELNSRSAKRGDSRRPRRSRRKECIIPQRGRRRHTAFRQNPRIARRSAF